MFALNKQNYLRLQNFRPTEKAWIRLWLDGLHDGTHVHWQLSPLSILSFWELQSFLKPVRTWENHSKAIARMASRRRNSNWFFGAMPSLPDEKGWDAFFDAQTGDTKQKLERMATWHREWIASDDTSQKSMNALWVQMNELAALLMLRGYSTDNLFNHVKDSVIDAKDHQGGTAQDRLDSFFDHFADPRPTIYWVWTKVLSHAELSTNRLRDFSLIRLVHPWDLVSKDRDTARQSEIKDEVSTIPAVPVLLKSQGAVTP